MHLLEAIAAARCTRRRLVEIIFLPLSSAGYIVPYNSCFLDFFFCFCVEGRKPDDGQTKSDKAFSVLVARALRASN
jgi:hypothetical protein